MRSVKAVILCDLSVVISKVRLWWSVCQRSGGQRSLISDPNRSTHLLSEHRQQLNTIIMDTHTYKDSDKCSNFNEI